MRWRQRALIVLYFIHISSQNTGRSENERQDKEQKCKNVFIVARYVTGKKTFRPSENKAPEDCARHASDAAQHCSHKGLNARDKADVEVDLTDMGSD